MITGQFHSSTFVFVCVRVVVPLLVFVRVWILDPTRDILTYTKTNHSGLRINTREDV